MNIVSWQSMDLSTAINIFLRQAIRENAIPFAITREVPNVETIAAMREAEDMEKHPENYKSYSSFADSFQNRRAQQFILSLPIASYDLSSGIFPCYSHPINTRKYIKKPSFRVGHSDRPTRNHHTKNSLCEMPPKAAFR